MSDYTNPTISTHVPLTMDIPNEEQNVLTGRPDIPPPSLWQRSVRVTHKVTKKPAVVVRVDWATNMFRAFYPDEMNASGELGRFAERTEWQHCRDWDVDVTFSPQELERQAARKLLEEEIAKLNREDLAAFSVFCDDPDPAKNLGKLHALRKMGVIKGEPEVVAVAMTEAKAEKAAKK